MHKARVSGYVGRDPQMRMTADGRIVTDFTLAVNRSSKQADGASRTETDWYSIVAWDRFAEICEDFVKKGMKVLVEGRLQLRHYTDQSNVQRVAVEVVVTDLELLTPREKTQEEEETTRVKQQER
jgi:single-strand DNA-binding protein